MEEDDKRKNLDFVPSSYEEVEEVEEDFVDETRLDICHLEICFLCYSSPIVDHIHDLDHHIDVYDHQIVACDHSEKDYRRGDIRSGILSYIILANTFDIFLDSYQELWWARFCVRICNCRLEYKDLFETFDTTLPFSRVEVELSWEVSCEDTCRTSHDNTDLSEIFDTTHHLLMISSIKVQQDAFHARIYNSFLWYISR